MPSPAQGMSTTRAGASAESEGGRGATYVATSSVLSNRLRAIFCGYERRAWSGSGGSGPGQLEGARAAHEPQAQPTSSRERGDDGGQHKRCEHAIIDDAGRMSNASQYNAGPATRVHGDPVVERPAPVDPARSGGHSAAGNLDGATCDNEEQS